MKNQIVFIWMLLVLGIQSLAFSAPIIPVIDGVGALNDDCEITSLPYTQNFDVGTTIGQRPPCWTGFNNMSNNFPQVYSGQYYSSPNSLYFNGTIPNPYCMIVSPEINSAIPLDSMQVTFMLRIATTNPYFIVGVVTDITDVTSFVPIDTVSATTINTWESHTVSFADYSGTGRRIAFKLSGAAFTCLDDVVMDYIPAPATYTITSTCGTNGTISPVGAQTVTEHSDITFTITPNTNYFIQRLLIDDSAVTVSNTYTFTDVTANHTIYAEFASSCGITSLPYTQNFDVETTIGQRPPCWTGFNNMGNNFPQVFSGQYYSSPNSLYFNGTVPNPYCLIASPEINSAIPLDSMQVTFMLRTATTNPYFIVGVVTDITDVNSFVPVDTVSAITINTWESHTVSFADYSGTGRHIAFKLSGAAFTCLDDVVMDYIPAPATYTITSTCGTNGTISPVGAQTVTEHSDITFTITPNTNYFIQRLLIDDSVVTVSNTYTFTDVTANHTIYAEFASSCGIASLPYTQNFDVGTTIGQRPPCWTGFNNMGNNFPQVFSGQYYSSPNSLYFNGTVPNPYCLIASPEINSAIPLDSMQVTFMLRIATTNPYFIVGVVTDITDVTSFVPIDTVSATTINTWESHTVSFANYSGTGRRIAFKLSGAALTSLDDVVIDYIPVPVNYTINSTCGANGTITPSGAQTVTEHSDITFTITPNTNYFIQRLLIDDSAVTVSNTYTFTDVNANHTIYAEFASSCGITSLPYTQNFDVGTTIGQRPPCWTGFNNMGNNFPQVFSGQYYSSPNSLYFNGTVPNPYCLIASPEINSAIPLDSMQVTFMLRTATTNPYFIVGVVTDITDVNSFVPVDTVSAITINTWESHTVSFADYSGTGRHIAFKLSGAAFTCLDDVVMDYIPAPATYTITSTCGTNGTISPVGAQTVTEHSDITFTITPNTNYFIQRLLIDDSAVTVSNTYTFTDVTANHTIYAEFASSCGITSLPYTQNFDVGTTIGQRPPCWTGFNNMGNNFPQVFSGQYYSSPNSLYFNGTVPNPYCLIASPEINSAIPLDSMQVTFMLRTATTNPYFIVGVVTDITDVNSFVPVDTVSAITINTWESHTVNFADYSGTGRHIAFKLSGAAFTCLDDVVMDYIPAPATYTITSTCGTNGTISPVGAQTVTEHSDITFTITPNTNYFIQRLLIDDSVVTVSNTYTFTDVTANHTIYAEFASSCGIASLPYTQNFDVGTTIGQRPPCWTGFNNMGNNFPQVFSGQYYSSPNSLYFNGTVPNPYCLIASPEINSAIPLDSMQVTFMLRIATTNPYFIVGVVTDITDVTSFVPIDTVSATTINTWESHTVSFANYSGTGRRIAFKLSGAALTSLDDVVIDYIPAPVNYTITGSCGANGTINPSGAQTVTEHSDMTFSITPNTNYFIQRLLIDDSAVTVSNTYTFTDVTANHTIYAEFASSCGITSLPYTQNFDVGTTIGQRPPCWTGFNNMGNNFPQVFSGQYYSSPNSLYFNGTVPNPYCLIASPEINSAIPLDSMQVTFMLRTATTNPYFIVGVVTDITDVNSFVPVDTVSAITINTWESHTVNFADYSGTGRHIAFKLSGAAFTCLDDVVMDYIPAPATYTITSTCGTNGTISPVGAQTVTEHSDITFTITPNTNYFIQRLLIDDSAVTVSNTYTFTDVTANHTIYAEFASSCGITSLPYTQNFDVGTTIGQRPPCWTGFNNMGNNFPQVFSGQYYSSPNSLYFNGTVPNPYCLIASPEINSAIPLDSMQVTFMLRTATTNPYFIVGVVTDITDVNSFVPVDTVSAITINTWESHTVNFADYSGTGRHIAFKLSGAALTSLDDVVMDYIPAPATYTITSTCGTNGTISPVGAQTVTEHSDITFTITPNTNYFIQRLLIDDSAVTVSNTYTFTDVTANHTIYAEFALNCEVPSNLTAGNITHDSATLTWDCRR